MAHIYIASDHAGYDLKNELVAYARELGHEVEDCGAPTLDPEDDYPQLIGPCAQKVADNPGSFGIILGGSGQGEAMVANRTKGVRATVFYGEGKAQSSLDKEGASAQDGYDIVRVSRNHNDANILSLGARFLTSDEAKKAVQVFLETPFSHLPRHERRIAEF